MALLLVLQLLQVAKNKIRVVIHLLITELMTDLLGVLPSNRSLIFCFFKNNEIKTQKQS
jgi:hypothetical protein